MNKLAGYLRKGQATFADLAGQLNAATQLSGIVPVANGGKDTQPLTNYGGMNFNGSTTYLDGNALTGIADSKVGTIFLVVRFANAASANEYIIGSTGEALAVLRLSTGGIRIVAENAAGTGIMQLNAATGIASAAGTYIIAASWDLAVPGSGSLYVNGVSSLTATTYTDDTIDYTVAEYAVGARSIGSSLLSGDIYVVWFDPTARMDFSAASNLRKFFDINRVLNFLGTNGELPTGTPPALFLGYSMSDNWDKNKGLFTATSFTRNGAIADVTTPIQGQYGGRSGQTNTATGTTGAQTINRRAGTVNFAAGASTLVVTNNLVRSDSIVVATMMTNDATALGVKSVEVSSSGGSFTIRLGAAATGETKVGFWIVG